MRKRRKRELEREEWALRVMATPKLWALVSYIRKHGGTLGGRRRCLLWCLCVAFRSDLAAYRALGHSISGVQWIKGLVCPIPAWPEKKES